MRSVLGGSISCTAQAATNSIEVKLFVVSTEPTGYVGAQKFGSAVFQLDGFHLSRACGRGYGRKLRSAIYDAIRSGSHQYARALMSAAEAVQNGQSATGSTSSPTLQRMDCMRTGSPTASVGSLGVLYYGSGQAHLQQNEEAGDELEHTPGANRWPIRSSYANGELDTLSHKDCLWLGSNDGNPRPVRERPRSTT